MVGLVLAGLIALFGVPLVLYVWLWYTKISGLKLTLTYLVLTAVVCGLIAFSPSRSLFSLTVSALAFIFTLPWNVVTLWVLSMAHNSDSSDREFAAAMLFGAGVNAVILFFIAKKLRSLIE